MSFPWFTGDVLVRCCVKDKFPIFDKKSAEAAIDLRGHAPAKDRAKIINKAAKYAPAAAKKAREADKK